MHKDSKEGLEKVPLKRWELENSVTEASQLKNSSLYQLLYQFDPEAHATLVEQQPWKNNPRYFKSIWISAVALLKMVIHARSEPQTEIMGLMKGKVMGDAFIIMDAFGLPVLGTETRVNAGEEANEYMVSYQEASEKINRKESIIGWYHSHPGYGCWLSGTDVETETLYQQHQDPFVAVVIDPTRTCAVGRVELKAFRCFPKGYKPSNVEHEFQIIPANKVSDYGLHWRRYYALDVNIFKSKLDDATIDFLWGAHWSITIMTSCLVANTQLHNQLIKDFKTKLETFEALAAKYVQYYTSKKKYFFDDLRDCCIQGKEAAIEKLKFFSTLVLTISTFIPPELPIKDASKHIIDKLQGLCRDLDI